MECIKFDEQGDGSLKAIVYIGGRAVGVDCEATHNHPHNNGRRCPICNKIMINVTPRIVNELDPFCDGYPEGKPYFSNNFIVR